MDIIEEGTELAPVSWGGVGGQVGKLNNNFSEIQDYTGWASYKDTQYDVEGSAFSIVGAAAYVPIPNNKGNSLEVQLPSDYTTLYDGSVILGKEGDGLNLTISFAIKPTSNATTRVTVVPDIGGAVGEIKDYERDIVFSKGVNEVQRYVSSFNVYTLDTWEANGATLKIKADADCNIFDIRYMITRTHKARI